MFHGHTHILRIVPINSDVLALYDEQKQGNQYAIWCFLIGRWVGVIARWRLAFAGKSSFQCNSRAQLQQSAATKDMA